MIKYNLKCNNNHEFESWFSDSTEFDKLKKKKIIRMHILFFKKYSKIHYGTNDFWYEKK